MKTKANASKESSVTYSLTCLKLEVYAGPVAIMWPPSLCVCLLVLWSVSVYSRSGKPGSPKSFYWNRLLWGVNRFNHGMFIVQYSLVNICV